MRASARSTRSKTCRVSRNHDQSSGHDLRHDGVSENTAKNLTGHKTRAVFGRYDIVWGADMNAAVAKLAERESGA